MPPVTRFPLEEEEEEEEEEVYHPLTCMASPQVKILDNLCGVLYLTQRLLMQILGKRDFLENQPRYLNILLDCYI